jgi:hypothetical protein
MSDNINEVLERLERACIAGMDAEYVDDVSALLVDHARLRVLVDDLDGAEIKAIKERDNAEKVIDRICDAVLGAERAEWSSAYYFEDAAEEVEDEVAYLRERVAELEAVPAIDLEQFRLSVDGALLSLNRLGAYGFEREAGPLANSVDYAALRGRLDDLLALIDGHASVRSSSEHI